MYLPAGAFPTFTKEETHDPEAIRRAKARRQLLITGGFLAGAVVLFGVMKKRRRA